MFASSHPSPSAIGEWLTRSRRTHLRCAGSLVRMSDHFFPATALGGKLYIDDTPQAETVVDMLVACVGHKKVRTAEELGEVVRTSERGLPAVRLWIHERLLPIARGI